MKKCSWPLPNLQHKPYEIQNFLPTNCFSVFDYFVRLALIELIYNSLFYSNTTAVQ